MRIGRDGVAWRRSFSTFLLSFVNRHCTWTRSPLSAHGGRRWLLRSRDRVPAPRKFGSGPWAVRALPYRGVNTLSTLQMLFACEALNLSLPILVDVLVGDLSGTGRRSTGLGLSLEGFGDLVLPTALSALERALSV